ncbi:hypothetical protein [Microbacterium hatanonis]|uniref:DUF3137 domain-containing protein n=1 Tax=Microbacterium hatanonis TaxID=404366 RepID=A0A5C8I1H9_9MICO|nr:hypothetical protein [Microbacterium hatanonis]TXK12862.1 hypothetical protein FVP77_05270 [Microbacterium hatanonis]
MDLRWMTAPPEEVAEAMATVRRESRPSWSPTKRQVLLHVNNCLLLWYMFVVFMSVGVQVDALQDGRLASRDVAVLSVTMPILAVWLVGTVLLYRATKRPPSARARLREWRRTLTALANGYEPRPSERATFSALITSSSVGVRAYPRFAARGTEFGALKARGPRATEWQYIAVKLSAPLPHLILDATSNDGVGTDLPAGVDRGQRLSLEGDFDRWFRVYSPARYGQDALYVLTPDLMAALIDHASAYNVEIVDDTLVFFTSPGVDFFAVEHWERVGAVLEEVVPRVTSKARQYLDERVPGQDVPFALAAVKAALDRPGVPWRPPDPVIGGDGRRLVVRNRQTGMRPVVAAIAWYVVRTSLYVVPGIFAFAGFMSIIDGR